MGFVKNECSIRILMTAQQQFSDFSSLLYLQTRPDTEVYGFTGLGSRGEHPKTQRNIRMGVFRNRAVMH